MNTLNPRHFLVGHSLICCGYCMLFCAHYRSLKFLPCSYAGQLPYKLKHKTSFLLLEISTPKSRDHIMSEALVLFPSHTLGTCYFLVVCVKKVY
jgi:hypothetical protein